MPVAARGEALASTPLRGGSARTTTRRAGPAPWFLARIRQQRRRAACQPRAVAMPACPPLPPLRGRSSAQRRGRCRLLRCPKRCRRRQRRARRRTRRERSSLSTKRSRPVFSCPKRRWCSQHRRRKERCTCSRMRSPYAKRNRRFQVCQKQACVYVKKCAKVKQYAVKSQGDCLLSCAELQYQRHCEKCPTSVMFRSVERIRQVRLSCVCVICCYLLLFVVCFFVSLLECALKARAPRIISVLRVKWLR